MRKIVTMLVSVCVLVLGLLGCTNQNSVQNNTSDSTNTSNVEFNNPIIEQRADPWVYKHTDGYYYFTGSVPEYDRIILRRAKTIQGLASAEEKVIWNYHETGEMSQHIWAPEIHHIDGKWYIYFAAGERDDIWKIRPFVLESDSENPLEGAWEEKGIMQTDSPQSKAFTDFSLDMTSFEHEGTRYAVWAEKRKGVSNLYIDELINPWTIAGNEVLISTPEHPWEKIGYWVNEGAAVLKRSGKIFMTFSASATDSNYAIGLLTASETDDLLNHESWTKSVLPVFQSNDDTGQYGPGHNSFTESEDGEHDIMIYHARPYEEIDGEPLYDPNRHTRAQVITWNEAGTPHFGVPAADTKVE
jgi:beta-galactosidase